MDVDIRKFAYKILDDAKDILKRDGELAPCACLFTAVAVQMVEVDLSEGLDQKRSEYLRIIDMAKQVGATAILTLNDARIGPPDPEYYDGKLEAENGQECIWITVSGPEISNWDITLPYRRTCDGIVFGDPKEHTGTQLNLMEGWASEKPHRC